MIFAMNYILPLLCGLSLPAASAGKKTGHVRGSRALQRGGPVQFDNDSLRDALDKYFADEVYAERIYGPIGTWDVSRVTSFQSLFSGYTKKKFNADISGWDTSEVTTMAYMFFGASKFNQDIGGWDTSKVETMEYMFDAAHSFNADISSWDTSRVTDMKYMLYKSEAFNQGYLCWDVQAVTDFQKMFQYDGGFNSVGCPPTQSPTSSPTQSPTSSPTQSSTSSPTAAWQVTLEEEDFDDASYDKDGPWGGWVCAEPGRDECQRIENSAMASSGSYSIGLHSFGPESALVKTVNIPQNSYIQARLTYSFYTIGYKEGEGFSVTVDGGTSSTSSKYEVGKAFTNDAAHTFSQVYSVDGLSSIDITFQNEGSGMIYIDDVKIEARDFDPVPPPPLP